MLTRDNANLDLLRATAVVLVVGSHLVMALGYLDHPWSYRIDLRQIAQLGVLMFFIHTSLVLMMSLHRSDSGDGLSAVRFYIRRAFRIYPLATLTVALAVLFSIPVRFEPGYVEPTLQTYFANLLLIQNLVGAPDVVGPMWSLPLEVQMYLVLPVIFLAARRIRSYAGAALLAAAGFLVWYADSHAARALGTAPLFEYAPWFFMGCAAYPLYRFAVPRLSATAYGLSLAALVATPSLLHALMQHDYRIGWVRWGIGLVFAALLPHFAQVERPIARRSAHIVATYSYGIYLSHVPILWLAFHKLAAWSFAAQLAVFAGLMLAVPVFLYHLFEQPFIRIGRRLAARIGEQPVRMPVPAAG